MDIQSSKIELAKLILNLENPLLIEKIKDVLKKEQKRLKLTTFEKKEIELAIDQLDKGKKIAFDDFVKKVS